MSVKMAAPLSKSMLLVPISNPSPAVVPQEESCTKHIRSDGSVGRFDVRSGGFNPTCSVTFCERWFGTSSLVYTSRAVTITCPTGGLTLTCCPTAVGREDTRHCRVAVATIAF